MYSQLTQAFLSTSLLFLLGDRHDSLRLFQAARLWNPTYVLDGALNVNFCKRLIHDLHALYGCITADLRDRLLDELPSYRRSAASVTSKVKDPLVWHWHARAKRPAFYEAAKLLVLLQPHSATVERVFSLVNQRFGIAAGMGSTLSSWIRLSCMLKFNKRTV